MFSEHNPETTNTVIQDGEALPEATNPDPKQNTDSPDEEDNSEEDTEEH